MIPNTHLIEYHTILKALEAREADIEARRSAAYNARIDRLHDLIERNIDKIPDGDDIPESVYQDLDKFLAFFGVKETHDIDDELDQAFIRDFFVERQSFWREAREVKREALEWKVKTDSLTLEYYYNEIAEREKHWVLDASNTLHDEIQAEVKVLKEMLLNLLADLYRDVEELKKSIAMSKLYLMSFHKDISN